MNMIFEIFDEKVIAKIYRMLYFTLLNLPKQ